MKLTIVYDNEVFKKGIDLQSDWGFACIIESKHDTILFDTGAKGEILLHNMKILNHNPEEITKIVISHEHQDHNGGLKALAPFINDIELFQLGHKSSYNGMKITIPEIPEKISEKVWTTGRLKGLVDEQSVVLKGSKGWHMLTGCSHIGVENILQVAQQIGTIVGIVGGFHGFTKFSYLTNFDLICPCHCTVHKDELKKVYPGSYSACGVGKVIDLNVGVYDG